MRVVFIAAIILALLTGYWLHNLLSSKAVHKTMDKKTEKVLMNPHGSRIIDTNGYQIISVTLLRYNNDSTYWITQQDKFNYISFDSATNVILFKQDTVFIHDTVYLKSKSKILDELMCDTCPKIEIPLIDKH